VKNFGKSLKNERRREAIELAESDAHEAPVVLMIDFGPADLGSRTEGPRWMRVRDAVAALETQGAPPTPRTIAAFLGLDVRNVYTHLSIACRRGLIERSGAGCATRYSAPSLRSDSPGLWSKESSPTDRMELVP
jgi:hypothetical protein